MWQSKKPEKVAIPTWRVIEDPHTQYFHVQRWRQYGRDSSGYVDVGLPHLNLEDAVSWTSREKLRPIIAAEFE